MKHPIFLLSFHYRIFIKFYHVKNKFVLIVIAKSKKNMDINLEDDLSIYNYHFKKFVLIIVLYVRNKENFSFFPFFLKCIT